MRRALVPVGRLDRDTTGVMLIAKSELALWRLGRQFELRRVHKTYTAIVHGLMGLDEDVIDMPIGRHPAPVAGPGGGSGDAREGPRGCALCSRRR